MTQPSRVVHDHASNPDRTAEVSAAPAEAKTAVLTIRNLPRRLRSDVESAMVVCIPTPSELEVADADPMTASWCTTWRRTPGSTRQIDCQEMITGTQRELGHLHDMLGSMAEEHDFDASLRLVA